jgi:predicted regulator of Ras-like GTPase activity (Roadblock/LC7/MglB family)
MPSTDLVLQEEDLRRFQDLLERLRQDANAKLTVLLDKNGQQLARAGDLHDIDPTALASLAAGNVAATEGLAQLIGEREFSILFHEGENDHLHINVVGGRSILVVLFDERSSLGLVRLRVKKATAELVGMVDDIHTRAESTRVSPFGGSSPFAEITDEDIDALFS